MFSGYCLDVVKGRVKQPSNNPVEIWGVAYFQCLKKFSLWAAFCKSCSLVAICTLIESNGTGKILRDKGFQKVFFAEHMKIKQ